MDLARANPVPCAGNWSGGRHVIQFCTMIHGKSSGGVWRGQLGLEMNEWHRKRKHSGFHQLLSCVK